MSRPRRISRRRRPSGERGSFTFAVLFWALMVMALAGLIVDGGLSITERQRAGDIAEQAARRGANDLDQNKLRQGTYALAGDACAQAASVVTASGLDANAAITGCDPNGALTLASGQTVPTIKITIRIQYQPILIGMIYTGQFIANASANAHPEPGN